MMATDVMRIIVAGIMVASSVMGKGEGTQIGDRNNGHRALTVKLVSEYENNRVYDVTPDGMALLYSTNAPVRILTGREQPKSTDFLRVMEIRSGREIARKNVDWFPTQMQFIPDEEAVFYREPSTAAGKGGFIFWNYRTGTTSTCEPSAPLDVRKLVFVERTRAFAEMSAGLTWNRLGELVVPSCSWRVIGPSYPSREKEGGILSPMVVSPDRKQIAHSVYLPYGIVVRDGVTGEPIRMIEASPFVLGPHLLFSPDGKYLLAVAADSVGDRQATRRYILFYETKGYRLAKKLDVTHWRPWDTNYRIHGTFLGTALTLSPDSRLMALAQSNGSKATIGLYSVENGQEVARASHPSVISDRNDPWAAEVQVLRFSPDGKYLLSSTNHNRIWRVE